MTYFIIYSVTLVITENKCIIKYELQRNPYFSYKVCDGKSGLRLIYTLSVDNICSREPGNQVRVELGHRGHYPLVDECSHPVCFSDCFPGFLVLSGLLRVRH